MLTDLTKKAANITFTITTVIIFMRLGSSPCAANIAVCVASIGVFMTTDLAYSSTDFAISITIIFKYVITYLARKSTDLTIIVAIVFKDMIVNLTLTLTYVAKSITFVIVLMIAIKRLSAKAAEDTASRKFVPLYSNIQNYLQEASAIPLTSYRRKCTPSKTTAEEVLH